MSSQLRTWSFICIFVKNCHTVAWFATIWDLRLCELCGFSLWSCQLWLYLLLSVRYVELYGSSHVLQFGVFIVFLDTVLMDSDRYRCIFRSTTIIFEIIGISAPYSFPTISYRFRFREKDIKTKVIWPPIDRFRSFSSLAPMSHPNPTSSSGRPAVVWCGAGDESVGGARTVHVWWCFRDRDA
jgi:hypothetical protein